MPKVNIQTLIDGSLVIKYNCECGEPLILETNKKPSRLMKCPDCMETEGVIFRDDELLCSQCHSNKHSELYNKFIDNGKSLKQSK